MATNRTAYIQLPPLSDAEASHLLEVLHDLCVIVQAHYEIHPSAETPSADIRTIDLFGDELPF
jgi:hypothetical protein